MEEITQQKDSNLVITEYEASESLKELDNDEKESQLHKKPSEVISGDAVSELNNVNTNGIDDEEIKSDVIENFVRSEESEPNALPSSTGNESKASPSEKVLSNDNRETFQISTAEGENISESNSCLVTNPSAIESHSKSPISPYLIDNSVNNENIHDSNSQESFLNQSTLKENSTNEIKNEHVLHESSTNLESDNKLENKFNVDIAKTPEKDTEESNIELTETHNEPNVDLGNSTAPSNDDNVNEEMHECSTNYIEEDDKENTKALNDNCMQTDDESSHLKSNVNIEFDEPMEVDEENFSDNKMEVECEREVDDQFAAQSESTEPTQKEAGNEEEPIKQPEDEHLNLGKSDDERKNSEIVERMEESSHEEELNEESSEKDITRALPTEEGDEMQTNEIPIVEPENEVLKEPADTQLEENKVTTELGQERDQIVQQSEEESTVQQFEEKKSSEQFEEEEESTVQQPEKEESTVLQPEEEKSMVQQSEEEEPTVQQSENKELAVQQPEEEESNVQQPEEEESSIQQTEKEESTVQQPEVEENIDQEAEEREPFLQQLELEKPTVNDLVGEESTLQQLEFENSTEQGHEKEEPSLPLPDIEKPAEKEEEPILQPPEVEKPIEQELEEEEPASRQAETEKLTEQEVEEEEEMAVQETGTEEPNKQQLEEEPVSQPMETGNNDRQDLEMEEQSEMEKSTEQELEEVETEERPKETENEIIQTEENLTEEEPNEMGKETMSVEEEKQTEEIEKEIVPVEEEKQTEEIEKEIVSVEEEKQTEEIEKEIMPAEEKELTTTESEEKEQNVVEEAEQQEPSAVEIEETEQMPERQDAAVQSDDDQSDGFADEPIMMESDNDEPMEIDKECEDQSTVQPEKASDKSKTANESRTEKADDSESTSEKDKVMDTEIVNCGDVDVDLSDENEKNNIGEQTETNRNEIQIEEMDVDKVADEINVTEEADKEKESKESRKEVRSVEENDSVDRPGSSEAETITGDTNNQAPAELAEGIGKDAEVCIVPDDMTLRLSVTSQKEPEKETPQTADTQQKTIKVATPQLEKHCDNKTDSADSNKSRPVRNAAKLAGNKIKTLVRNDLTVEETEEREKENESESESDVLGRLCSQCGLVKPCKYQIVQGGLTQHLCSDACYNILSKGTQPEIDQDESSCGTFTRKCSQCRLPISGDEKNLSWETMDFCNEECLGKYQTELGAFCSNCEEAVQSASMGKYCVRFGYDVKQFCTASCLEEYKKGLKVCSYCQKDISTGVEGFLAPVGDKGQFKDFCTQSCMEKYEQMSSNTPPLEVIAECAVCSNKKQVKVEVELDCKTQKLCSEPCFAAFKFVNNITEGQCDMCRKYFDRVKTENFTIYYDDAPHSFCCKTCMNVYILANRKIVPCNWCKVKKYNFDMIKKSSSTGQILMMCSLNCLMLYQVSVNAVSSRRIKCDFCLSVAQAQYHLTMSDATIRNFCGYSCVMSFQNQYPKPLTVPGKDQISNPIPTGGPKKVLTRRAQPSSDSSCVPVISSVHSLASPNGPSVGPKNTAVASKTSRVANEVNIVPQVTSISQPITIQPPPPPQIYQQIITKPPPAKEVKNKAVLCKPYTHTKGVSCRPHPCMKETQTEETLTRKCLIPVPVPIFVPAPMHMFASPFPVIVPFPLPVPVPIFIPTTRNSAKGIFKEIKKIQEKIPTDPFEAELLMMAEMVAGEKKQDPTDSESEEGNDGDDGGDGSFSPENVDTSNTFGDDMLQMALKMASELEEPAVDMESVLTSNTITPTSQPPVDPNKSLYASDPDDPDPVPVMSMNRGRKRAIRGSRSSSGGSQSKRGRRTSGSVDVPMLPPPEPVPPPRIEVEKPDANMCLKYTFGVNAWRHWVMQKNAELEKAALTNRKIKLFKPELLQLTADELNFSLCLFVKEVRKPNGQEYAPDTIYYLCLGIQQYLFENGRIDNIFTDSFYEKFTDCLDEVAKKFAALYNDSQYIVTRVEEEHLWESKQLGAHSPHVLLSTLMFFNTKHFNLVTVEEHMQLSFSHIMKHWKRNPNAPGVAKVPGSRNVLLRFYPPQSALEANSRKKKVYEQQENEENPLRCPVKLYEFYLSKCPESVKTRNDVFYLLPERSCVPDSPVWYSTMALGKEPLMKMLHRVKMVKEINIALLTC